MRSQPTAPSSKKQLLLAVVPHRPKPSLINKYGLYTYTLNPPGGDVVMRRSRKLCRQRKANAVVHDRYNYDDIALQGAASSGRSGQGGLTAGRKEDDAVVDNATDAQLRQEGMWEFERYYRTQNILEADQWDRFMSSLRQPLPITFRVAKTR